MKSLNLDNMSNHNSPYYSDKYTDDKFEYRHVHIPREWVKAMPKDRTMTEQEWRELGVQQSQGWVHYMIHEPEPHVLLFRRAIKG